MLMSTIKRCIPRLLFVMMLCNTCLAFPSGPNYPGLKKEATIKVGIARIDITPDLPIWLTGYANRKQPGDAVAQKLFAKAIVIEENPTSKIIIVTVDLLGLSREIVEDVRKAAETKYGINRSQLLFNSSHTHSGPMIWPNLDVIYDFDFASQQKVSSYTQQLTKNLIAVIDNAMAHLSEATMYSGHGEAGFAINRRGAIHPGGPTDHDVPVIKVTGADGKIMAILFGYACHNTTVVEEANAINGDYAGYAQEEIEKNNPGATAFFLMGCAGDQNPEPRVNLKDAAAHGKELASVVQKVLTANMQPVRAPIRTDYEVAVLHFRPQDVAVYQKEIVDTNIYRQRRAKLMLEAYNKGWSNSTLNYPMQVVRFGKDFTLLALSDEVVVDYSLDLKKVFKGENLYVAGYCNEVQCYIPNKRILKEGGYEADDSMIYYAFPGPFSDDVEDIVKATAMRVMQHVGAKAAK